MKKTIRRKHNSAGFTGYMDLKFKPGDIVKVKSKRSFTPDERVMFNSCSNSLNNKLTSLSRRNVLAVIQGHYYEYENPDPVCKLKFTEQDAPEQLPQWLLEPALTPETDAVFQDILRGV
jgi:hypothetical protein